MSEASNMRDVSDPPAYDIAVIGAGAAGLFAALAARGVLGPDGAARPVPDDAPTVVVFDGQTEPGRKILISGGGRCNVTNETVTADDFLTSTPKLVRNALREFGPDQARHFFETAGVPLHVESLGKVFPNSNRAHDILDALLTANHDAGVRLAFGQTVAVVLPLPDGTWSIDGIKVRRVILATGGLSIPATGSTGFGYDLATSLGHTLCDRVPALAAVLGGIGGDDLAGVTVPAVVTVEDAEGRVLARAGGSTLFTHHGVTGPAPLDVSHAVEHQIAAGRLPRAYADLWTLADPDGPFGPYFDDPKLPGCSLAQTPRPTTPDELSSWIDIEAAGRPRTLFGTLLGERLPRRLVALLAGDHADVPLGQLRRIDRVAVATRLTRLDLRATGTAGYQKAEVTAGGIPLTELDRRTLESRLAPGLHACGEVCDVTGRLGGFNFQWAWTSGWLAGRGAAAGMA